MYCDPIIFINNYLLSTYTKYIMDSGAIIQFIFNIYSIFTLSAKSLILRSRCRRHHHQSHHRQHHHLRLRLLKTFRQQKDVHFYTNVSPGNLRLCLLNAKITISPSHHSGLSCRSQYYLLSISPYSFLLLPAKVGANWQPICIVATFCTILYPSPLFDQLYNSFFFCYTQQFSVSLSFYTHQYSLLTFLLCLQYLYDFSCQHP